MTFSRTKAHSPYMEYAKLRSAAKYNLATSGVMSYPLARSAGADGRDWRSMVPIRTAMCRCWSGSRSTMGLHEENVVTAAGTSLANHLAMAATFEPGDEVLIEEPTYELLLNTAAFLGAKIRRFPRHASNAFAIDPEDVRKAVTPRTRLIVITNLHNPSSVQVDEATLRQIGEWAAAVGARVLVDEVYLEASGRRDQSRRSTWESSSW